MVWLFQQPRKRQMTEASTAFRCLRLLATAYHCLPLSSHGGALPAARNEERRVGRLRADERPKAQCCGVGLVPDMVSIAVVSVAAPATHPWWYATGVQIGTVYITLMYTRPRLLVHIACSICCIYVQQAASAADNHGRAVRTMTIIRTASLYSCRGLSMACGAGSFTERGRVYLVCL